MGKSNTYLRSVYLAMFTVENPLHTNNIVYCYFVAKVKQVLDEIIEKLPDEFNMGELMAKAEERTPYTVVALQECDRMNSLTNEMKISLRELDLGLKVIE